MNVNASPARGAGTRRLPPRAHGRSEVLTREEILTAAFALADSLGLEQVTMRAIAENLGVSAMSLYAHVTDKDDILDALLDRRMRASGVPASDLDWHSWMFDASERLRQLLVAEPALLDRYCRRPVGVPAALDRMEAAFSVLERSGFDADQAEAIFAAVHTYTIGFAALESTRANAGPTRARRPGRGGDVAVREWPTYFAALDPVRYPELRRIRPDLEAITGPTQFRAGLTALLTGLGHPDQARHGKPLPAART